VLTQGQVGGPLLIEADVHTDGRFVVGDKHAEFYGCRGRRRRRRRRNAWRRCWSCGRCRGPAGGGERRRGSNRGGAGEHSEKASPRQSHLLAFSTNVGSQVLDRSICLDASSGLNDESVFKMNSGPPCGMRPSLVNMPMLSVSA